MDKALVKQNYAGFPLSNEEIESWADLLKSRHVEPYNVKPENRMTDKDFKDVIVSAIAEGYNPLSKSFYYWKYSGAVTFMEKYTHLTNWAQKVRPYSFFHKMRHVGHERRPVYLGKDDLFCEVFLVFPKEQEMIQQAVNQRLSFLSNVVKNMSYDEASAMIEKVQEDVARSIASPGEGLLEGGEYLYQGSLDKKRFKLGWTPEQACIKRGLVNAIKRRIGEPDSEERRRLADMALLDTRRYATTIEEIGVTDDASIQKVHALEDHANRYIDEVEQLDQLREQHEGIEVVRMARRQRRNNRVSMMRGADSIKNDPLDDSNGTQLSTPPENATDGEIVPDEAPKETVISQQEPEDVSAAAFANGKEDVVKQILATNMVANRDRINDASNGLFGISFAELDPLGESLLLAYAKRLALIKKKKAATIPEFKNGVPDDPKSALTALVKDYYGKQKVMEEL